MLPGDPPRIYLTCVFVGWEETQAQINGNVDFWLLMWAWRYLLIQWVCSWIVLSGRLPPGDQIKPTFGRYVNPIRSSEKYSCCFVVCWYWNSLITFVKENTCRIHLANFQHQAFSTSTSETECTNRIGGYCLVGLTDGLDNQLPRWPHYQMDYMMNPTKFDLFICISKEIKEISTFSKIPDENKRIG